MKCPKCANELKIFTGTFSKITSVECFNCGYDETHNDYLKEITNQRVGKLLSKFDTKFKGTKLEYKYIKLPNDGHASYGELYFWKDKFRLIGNKFIISLETVESLLKDLEECK